MGSNRISLQYKILFPIKIGLLCLMFLRRIWLSVKGEHLLPFKPFLLECDSRSDILTPFSYRPLMLWIPR